MGEGFFVLMGSCENLFLDPLEFFSSIIPQNFSGKSGKNFSVKSTAGKFPSRPTRFLLKLQDWPGDCDYAAKDVNMIEGSNDTPPIIFPEISCTTRLLPLTLSARRHHARYRTHAG